MLILDAGGVQVLSAPALRRTAKIIGHFTACGVAFRTTPSASASGGYDLPASIYEPIAGGVSAHAAVH